MELIFLVFFIVIFAITYAVCVMFFSENGERPTHVKLISAGIDFVMVALPSYFDTLMQFIYDAFHIEKSEAGGGVNLCILVTGIVLIVFGLFDKYCSKGKKYTLLNMQGPMKHEAESNGMHQIIGTTAANCTEITVDALALFLDMQKLTQTNVDNIINNIRTHIADFCAKNTAKCFTGMAPIPFMVYAGTQHKGGKIDKYLEFDGSKNEYTLLGNEKEYPALITSQIQDFLDTTVVVAFSTTSHISDANTRQFRCPVFRVGLSQAKDNAIFSRRQLDEYVAKTLQFMEDLGKKNSNLRCINLLCATQGCFAYAFGKSLINFRNRICEVVVWQYSASSTPVYPIGLSVNGNKTKLVKA